jgi:hypothetical protein
LKYINWKKKKSIQSEINIILSGKRKYYFLGYNFLDYKTPLSFKRVRIIAKSVFVILKDSFKNYFQN